nr:unnamed protein product [Digitaria exilis]
MESAIRITPPPPNTHTPSTSLSSPPYGERHHLFRAPCTCIGHRLSRGPCRRYLPDPDDSCRFTFSRLLSLPLVAMARGGERRRQQG